MRAGPALLSAHRLLAGLTAATLSMVGCQREPVALAQGVVAPPNEPLVAQVELATAVFHNPRARKLHAEAVRQQQLAQEAYTRLNARFPDLAAAATQRLTLETETALTIQGFREQAAARTRDYSAAMAAQRAEEVDLAANRCCSQCGHTATELGQSGLFEDHLLIVSGTAQLCKPEKAIEIAQRHAGPVQAAKLESERAKLALAKAEADGATRLAVAKEAGDGAAAALNAELAQAVRTLETARAKVKELEKDL